MGLGLGLGLGSGLGSGLGLGLVSGSLTISGTMLASSAAPAGGALELVSHGGGAAPGTGDLSSVGWKKGEG